MSYADEYRELADECRAIPDEHGLREHTVSLVTSYWTGGLPGVGDEVEASVPITVFGTSPPKVRFPTQREIALGLMSEGSVVVGPFTPDYGTGGFNRSLLDGSLVETGETLHLLITGPQHPDGQRYRIKNSNVDRALRIVLTCVPAGS
jgi:hypothetical protein